MLVCDYDATRLCPSSFETIFMNRARHFSPHQTRKVVSGTPTIFPVLVLEYTRQQPKSVGQHLHLVWIHLHAIEMIVRGYKAKEEHSLAATRLSIYILLPPGAGNRKQSGSRKPQPAQREATRTSQKRSLCRRSLRD
jgi:hypothetical protein